MRLSAQEGIRRRAFLRFGRDFDFFSDTSSGALLDSSLEAPGHLPKESTGKLGASQHGFRLGSGAFFRSYSEEKAWRSRRAGPERGLFRRSRARRNDFRPELLPVVRAPVNSARGSSRSKPCFRRS